MKRNVLSALLVCGLVGAAGSVSAAELVTTVVKGKGSQSSISFDLVSDVQVAAFNFEIQIPGLDASKAKIESCGSELPAGFDAKCHISKGSLMMYAVSSNPKVGIGPGLAGIGRIELSSGSFAKGAVTVSSLAAFDQAGNSLGLSSKLDTGAVEGVAK